jgi:tRNA G18 (ribose-2'-O)-methylase SpoU
MNRFPIGDSGDARLDPFRDLKSHRLKQRSRTFIVEGPTLVRRMLSAGWQPESILVSEGRELEHADWLPVDVARYVVPDALTHELIGFKFHAGVLASGLRRPNPPLEKLVADPAGKALIVAVADVVDPENTGGIIRACAAFGADAALLGETCADPFSRRVLRVSMGNGFSLPIREARCLTDDLVRLEKEFGFSLVATVLDPDAEPVDRFRRPPRCVLVLGNEARGIPGAVLELCGRKVTIPMRRGTDSLNVHVAAAVFLHRFLS